VPSATVHVRHIEKQLAPLVFMRRLSGKITSVFLHSWLEGNSILNWVYISQWPVLVLLPVCKLTGGVELRATLAAVLAHLIGYN